MLTSNSGRPDTRVALPGKTGAGAGASGRQPRGSPCDEGRLEHRKRLHLWGSPRKGPPCALPSPGKVPKPWN